MVPLFEAAKFCNASSKSLNFYSLSIIQIY